MPVREPSAHFPKPLCGRFYRQGTEFVLSEPLELITDGLRIEVPADFETDFNSTPRMLWWWFPPTSYPEAGVVHDYLYRNPGVLNRQQCDAVHRLILKLEGMRESKRNAAYAGLRIGGWRPWNRYRRADQTARPLHQ